MTFPFKVIGFIFLFFTMNISWVIGKRKKLKKGTLISQLPSWVIKIVKRVI